MNSIKNTTQYQIENFIAKYLVYNYFLSSNDENKNFELSFDELFILFLSSKDTKELFSNYFEFLKKTQVDINDDEGIVIPKKKKILEKYNIIKTRFWEKSNREKFINEFKKQIDNKDFSSLTNELS